MTAVNPSVGESFRRRLLGGVASSLRRGCGLGTGRYARDVGNVYYQPGQARSRRVEDLFARIARRYDLLNDLQSLGLHRGWKRRFVRMAEVKEGDRALDLCCGTGDIAKALADAGASVVGLDFSEPMLEVARSRSAARGNSAAGRMAFCRGDAQSIPFPEASFDVVTVAYGLRNLADWELGLEEMWRVLRPGGRLLVMDCGKPGNPIWRGLYYAYLKCWVPLLGRVVGGDAQAYSYILESLKYYAAQEGVTRKLSELGSPDVLEVNLMGGAMSLHRGRKGEGGR